MEEGGFGIRRPRVFIWCWFLHLALNSCMSIGRKCVVWRKHIVRWSALTLIYHGPFIPTPMHTYERMIWCCIRRFTWKDGATNNYSVSLRKKKEMPLVVVSSLPSSPIITCHIGWPRIRFSRPRIWLKNLLRRSLLIGRCFTDDAWNREGLLLLLLLLLLLMFTFTSSLPRNIILREAWPWRWPWHINVSRHIQ